MNHPVTPKIPVELPIGIPASEVPVASLKDIEAAAARVHRLLAEEAETNLPPRERRKAATHHLGRALYLNVKLALGVMLLGLFAGAGLVSVILLVILLATGGTK